MFSFSVPPGIMPSKEEVARFLVQGVFRTFVDLVEKVLNEGFERVLYLQVAGEKTYTVVGPCKLRIIKGVDLLRQVDPELAETTAVMEHVGLNAMLDEYGSTDATLAMAVELLYEAIEANGKPCTLNITAQSDGAIAFSRK